MRCLSVIVPSRNEAGYIDAFLDALARQHLPEGWSAEWLIAEGGSDDGTRSRLETRACADARIVLIENPLGIVSSGLNACLARARGEVIVRMDVHTTYPDDYLEQCLATLQRTAADNVGGPWVAAGSTPMQRAVAAAFQSRWVVGGARSRDVNFEGSTESVYLGCWPRSSFDRFGTFDETLVRNQDDEHNLRIVRGGGRVWQSGAIRSIYWPRANLRRLFAQQRQYGYWRAFVLRKHRTAASWRQLVPAALVAALIIAALAAPWVGPVPGMFVAGAYLLYLIFVTGLVATRSGWVLAGRRPLVIAVFQLGYGLGTWQGLFAIGFGRRPSRKLMELTR